MLGPRCAPYVNISQKYTGADQSQTSTMTCPGLIKTYVAENSANEPWKIMCTSKNNVYNDIHIGNAPRMVLRIVARRGEINEPKSMQVSRNLAELNHKGFTQISNDWEAQVESFYKRTIDWNCTLRRTLVGCSFKVAQEKLVEYIELHCWIEIRNNKLHWGDARN